MIHGIRFTPEQQASGQMPKHVHELVFCGVNQALGVFRFVVCRDVQTCDDHIQFRQQVIVKIQFVFQHIHFAAGQQTKLVAIVREFFVELFDGFDLIAHAAFVQTFRPGTPRASDR